MSSKTFCDWCGEEARSPWYCCKNYHLGTCEPVKDEHVCEACFQHAREYIAKDLADDFIRRETKHKQETDFPNYPAQLEGETKGRK